MAGWLQLLAGVTACSLSVRASADRDIVYAARYYNPPGSPRGLSHMQLYRINPDGTGRTRLTSGRHDHEVPVWSPSGKWIAYRYDFGKSSDSVRVCDARGRDTGFRWPVPSSAQECEIAWTPDSRAVLVTEGRWRSQEDWVNVTWRIPLRGGHPVRLNDLAGASWSPDGRHEYLSYYAYTTRHLPRDAITLSHGGRALPLTAPAHNPAWLDDSRLAGFLDVGAVAPVVVLAGLDGRELRRISFAGLLPKRMAESDSGVWQMLRRVPGTGTRMLCAKSGAHGLGGGREYDFLGISLDRPAMRWICDGMEMATGPGSAYCSVGITTLGTYGDRQVYIAPLRVGSLDDGAPHAIVSGLVWVESASWRVIRSGARPSRRSPDPGITHGRRRG